MVLPTSINIAKVIPNRHVQRPMLQVTLNSFKLTSKTKHNRRFIIEVVGKGYVMFSMKLSPRRFRCVILGLLLVVLFVEVQKALPCWLKHVTRGRVQRFKEWAISKPLLVTWVTGSQLPSPAPCVLLAATLPCHYALLFLWILGLKYTLHSIHFFSHF